MKAIFALSIVSIALFSCSSDNSLPNREKTKSAKEDKFVLKKTNYYELEGFINNSPVKMELISQDSLIHGSYVDVNDGISKQVNGKIYQNGELELNETDNFGDITAIFSGKFSSATHLSGLWGKINSKNKLAFELKLNSTKKLEFSIEHLTNKNCSTIQNIPEGDEMMPWDTMCTTLKIDLLKLKVQNELISEKINQALEKEYCKFAVGEVRPKTIKEFIQSVNNVEQDYGFEQEIWGRIESFSHQTICISISSYYYGFGAAHPYSFGNFYNYNCNTGKLVTLEELFIPNFKNKLNSIAEKLFIEANGDELWWFEKGKFELNRDFAIMPTGLLFVFDAYEIGPYAAGAPEVFIPYSKIIHLIKDKSLLNKN